MASDLWQRVMADKLAFVEVPAQLTQVPVDYHVISLSPLAEVALEQARRPYTRPEDYLDEMVLEEEGIANFAKVETLCAALDAIFAEYVPEVAEHELQPARWNYFWLKIVYDAFFIRTYQLRRVLAAEMPQEVLYFQRSQPDLCREWISKSESLYALLLDHLLPVLGITGRRLESVLEHPIKPQRAMLARFRSLLWLVRGSLGRVRRELKMMPQVFLRPSRGRVLCLDYSYSIPYIVPELGRLGYDVWIWRDGLNPYRIDSFGKHAIETTGPFSASQIDAVCGAVEGNQAIRDLFCWEGNDFWPVVSPRLQRLIKKGLPAVLNHFVAAQSTLKRIQPDVVLMSVAAYSREKTICHAARRAGIPTIVSRHGEQGTHQLPIFVYQDIAAVDWAMCWGKWEAAWVQRRAKRPVQVQITGAPMIEQESRKALPREVLRDRLSIGQHERVVLYLSEGLDFNWRYISYRGPSDSTYFRQQRAIISLLTEVGCCRVLVKRHPRDRDDGPLVTWISDNLSDKVTCIVQPQFGRLIHLPQVVVIDAPATTLVQAVQSTAQIYIYTSSFRWEPGVLEVLRRTCIVSDQFQEFSEQLKKDLVSGRAFEPRQPDQELLHCLADPMEKVGGAAKAVALTTELLLRDSL